MTVQEKARIHLKGKHSISIYPKPQEDYFYVDFENLGAGLNKRTMRTALLLGLSLWEDECNYCKNFRRGILK